MGVPHLRIMRRDGYGASMFCRGVLVHCPSRLGATVTVLTAELLCGDGMFTKRTLERAKTFHHFDGVMSHSFKCSRLSWSDSEPKLPSAMGERGQTGRHFVCPGGELQARGKLNMEECD